MRTGLFLIPLLTCAMVNTAAAQQIFPFRGSERPAEGWPAEVEEHYQPIVTDSTLLFHKPWLVWQCTCGWPIDYEFYYDIDFRTARQCWGRKEVFDRVEVNGQYGFVQRGLGELHAMLEPSGGGFLYTEVGVDSLGDELRLRTVQLVWDTDSVLRTDTAAVGSWGHEGLVTRITRYVELKPAR